MKTHAPVELAILLGAVLLGTGCVAESIEEGEPILLSTPAEGDRADAIWHKALIPEIAGEVVLEGTEHHGTTEVVLASETQVRVRSERIIVPAGQDRVVDISVDTEGTWTGITTEVRFAMAYRAPGLTDWEVVELEGTSHGLFGSSDITINFFEAVLLDPVSGELTFSDGVNFTSPRTVPLEGFSGWDVEYAIFVFPISNWGDMEGAYDYVLTATCDGGACDGGEGAE